MLNLFFKHTECKHEMIQEEWYQNNIDGYVYAQRFKCKKCDYIDTNPYMTYTKRRTYS